MSITTARPPVPPPPPRKRGWGCFGCGCAILLLLLALIVALVIGGSYFAYSQGMKLTSTTPMEVPTFSGGDDVYNSARQKMADFNHDLNNSQAATIQLSADEINAVIARNPDLAARNIHAFVTMANDQATVQGSAPVSSLLPQLGAGRYLNFNAIMSVDFDPGTKSLNVVMHSLQIGDETLPANGLPALQGEFNTMLNLELQKDPNSQNLLNRADSITIKDGQLVIQTK